MKLDIFSRRTRYLGGGVQHRPSELYFLDQILFEHKFKKIVEFGTMTGRTTLLFGIHALQTMGELITFDIRKEPRHNVWLHLKPVLPLTFYRLDAFSSETQQIVDKFVQKGKALIYCDNGKKKDEFNMYAHLLKSGDFIMAHDRGREIKDSHIKETIEMCDLEPMYEEYIEPLKLRQYCFRKREITVEEN